MLIILPIMLYAALLKNLPIMLKFMLKTYLLCSNYAQLFMPQFPCTANNFQFMDK